MKSHLLFVMTGARAVQGGIAASNLNVLRALVDLAAEKKLKLKIYSLLENGKARPSFVPKEIPLIGFKGSRWRLVTALLTSIADRPLFCFDHVRLALPLLPFAVTGLVKTMIFAHGSESWKRMRRTSRWSFEHASLCLTNSRFTLRKMEERILKLRGAACPLGLSPRFSLNHNVPPPPTFELELEAADGITRRLGKRVLLLVSRIEKREGKKGHRSLIRIPPALLKKFSDVQLVFPGPGDDRENLKEFANQSGMASRVFLPGWVSDETLRCLYHLCYAFVMPSRQEGFGLVYLEAMNYAKPCVGCFDQGAEEIIVPGETGYLVRDPDDSRELLGVLTTLLENPGRAEALGRKGFERLHQFFTARHYQERVKEAISKVLR